MDLLTKRRSAYVPALREPPPQVVEIEIARELPSAPISASMPYSGYVDRARGFTVSTAPLAGVVGFIVLLIGISAFGVPLLSVGSMLLALGGFAATWLIAYVTHTFVSSDGALFLHTILAWVYLRREQSERFRRYGLQKGRGL